jgi:hypothetical protein
LEAGRSYDAQADRVLAYHRAHAGPWERLSTPADVRSLRRRAKTCREQARKLDRLIAYGWAVHHDRIIPTTREVLDHVLVGPGGIAVLYTIPAVDRDPTGLPGPGTGATFDAVIRQWSQNTRPRLMQSLTARLPGWVSRSTAGSSSLAPTAPHLEAALTPTQVQPWLASLGSAFGPVHVQQLTLHTEQARPPAALTG